MRVEGKNVADFMAKYGYAECDSEKLSFKVPSNCDYAVGNTYNLYTTTPIIYNKNTLKCLESGAKNYCQELSASTGIYFQWDKCMSYAVFEHIKTGEKFVWDGFGDEQDMEFAELKSARSASKKYFSNNWFMFDDPEVVEQLGMTQFYRFALKIDEFDELFAKTPTEIDTIVSKLSDGQKKSVAYRAKQMVASGDIDSNKVINALEKSLGVELIER